MHVDTELLLTKIESLRKCIHRIEQKRPSNADILYSDIDIQDIISVNLERAVQQCVDIAAIIISGMEITPPATMASAFESLAERKIIDKELSERLKKAVGFRNIAVHEYDRINWDIVYSIITVNIDDFRKFTSAILVFIGKS